MTFTFNVVPTGFNPPNKIKHSYGLGKIEEDDTDLFLKIGNDRIVLDASLKKFFNHGDYIKYSILKETIFLAPLKEDIPAVTTVPTDVLAYTQPVQSSSPARLNTPSRMTISSNLPGGYYLFDEMEEALQFINQPENTDLKRQLETMFLESGIIVIKIDRAIDSNRSGFIFPTNVLPGMLQSTIGLFSSDFLRSLPSELYMEILMNTGRLPIDFFSNIDNCLVEMNSDKPYLPGCSTETQSVNLMQWLKTILSLPKTPDRYLSLLPFHSPHSIINNLTKVLPTLSTLTNNVIPDVNAYILSDKTIQQHRQNILEFAVNAMGLNLEHMIAENQKNTQGISYNSSIKSLLLHLMSKIPDNTLRSQKITLPMIPDDNLFSPLSTKPSTVSQMEIVSGTSDSTEGYRKLQSINKNLLTVLYDDLLPPILKTFDLELKETGTTGMNLQKNSLLYGQMQSIVSSMQTSVSLQAIIDTLQAIVSIVNDSPMALHHTPGHSPFQADETVKNGTIDQITSIIEQLKQLKVDAPYIDKRLSEFQPQIPQHSLTGLAVESLPDQLHTLFRTVADSIEMIVSLLRNDTSEWNSDIEMSARSSGNATQRIEIPNSSLVSEKNISGASGGFLQQTLSTTLDTIESLQLLARQVTTTEGTQQVIALPIKFGEHITEINIRLLNYHGGKKVHKNQTHFSVFINVTPPILGGIYSHLDYHRSKSLAVSVEFEQKSSLEWFTQHKDAFRLALQSIFHIVLVEFKLIHKTDTINQQNSQSSNGLIDVKA